MPPKSPAKGKAAAKPAEEPRLGLMPRRLLASAVMYAIAAAVLYQRLESSGMLRVVRSHLEAAAWNPLAAPPCGLLAAKEYVLLADRVVTPRGLVLPGAGGG